jgi:hypothetical protein
MEVRKRILFELPTVYTADVFMYNRSLCIGAGPEKDGIVKLYNLENGSLECIEPVPGGTMSLLPIPGKENTFVSVMGLFPPFIGFEAGIYLHEKKGKSWLTNRVLAVPFAHRCEILTINGINYLFSANVSKYKKNVEDWDEPGELYVTDLNKGIWEKELVMGNLWKNHGMLKYPAVNFPLLSVKCADELLFISGVEGIFVVYWADGGFKTEQIFNHEVSEFAFIEAEGRFYLATIEPFHGSKFNIYLLNGKFQKVYESPLEFGHGISAGYFRGKPSVAVGNRRGAMALELIQYENGQFTKHLLDENTAPTQTRFFVYNEVEYLLSANQNKNEVAIYL